MKSRHRILQTSLNKVIMGRPQTFVVTELRLVDGNGMKTVFDACSFTGNVGSLVRVFVEFPEGVNPLTLRHIEMRVEHRPLVETEDPTKMTADAMGTTDVPKIEPGLF